MSGKEDKDTYEIGTVLFTTGDAKHEDVWDDSELIDHWDRNLATYRKLYSSSAKDNKDPPYQHNQKKTSSGRIQKKKPATRKTSNNPSKVDQIQTETPSFLPPMPPLPTSQEELSNVMMAWYYCGYYTGIYQAQQQH